jgi:Flp pilus assembly protein TadG
MEQSLQTATKQASRQLMTGAAQTASLTQSQFQNAVCSTATAFNCSALMVDVESGTTFTDISTAPLALTYDGSGKVANTWNFNPGGPGDIVIMRVMYNWPIVGGPFAFGLSDQPNGGHLMVATVVFKNEPYAAT